MRTPRATSGFLRLLLAVFLVQFALPALERGDPVSLDGRLFVCSAGLVHQADGKAVPGRPGPSHKRCVFCLGLIGGHGLAAAGWATPTPGVDGERLAVPGHVASEERFRPAPRSRAPPFGLAA